MSFLREAAYFISEGFGTESTAFLIGELFISKADGLDYMACWFAFGFTGGLVAVVNFGSSIGSFWGVLSWATECSPRRGAELVTDDSVFVLAATGCCAVGFDFKGEFVSGS